MWTGENGGFRNRLRHWHWHVPVKKIKTDVFLSVFGGQVWTVENAAKTLVWTKNLFIRFQETENGGFRKRIGVDRALKLKSNLTILLGKY